MASARLFHCLPAGPVLSGPGPSQIISATTPTFGNLTTRLLDPALPPVGTAQLVQALTVAGGGISETTILGRWLTRPLPAQTIGAGNWVVAGVLSYTNSMPMTATLWGACLAQWREGTGVVARFFDTPGGGASLGAVYNADDSAATTFAGGALTLTANDALILELWCTHTANGSTSLAALLGGIGQYKAARYTRGSLTDTDLTLLTPAAVTLS